MHDLYASVYHGVGIALNDFRNYSELGNPWSFYVFQGARIFRLSPTLSVFYEWNFGISTGWKYYDKENNLYNTSVSSKNNAYINANFFFVWSISRTLDLSAGLALSHFSNGNTKQPNSGVNVFSGTVNMTYNIGRIYKEHVKSIRIRELNFDKHMIYELVLFGSWKRRGILLYGNETTQLVNSKPFGVGGITFSPLYSINPRLRLGGALDIVYDASANVTYSDYNYGKFDYYIPKFSDRLSAGIAAKVDYVMPIFTISVGLGMEVLRNGEDYRRFYQSLTLKTSLTERLFLNLGYRIKDFSLPSFLMLGVGYRFGQY
ncbi:MAG: acyloxyacyl hydrolase [Rikenellaceae bacterium]|nr:acyloxyacyl hydrolase [Rikenellaceae bacterium]